jgi:hypothetical protein
LRRKPSQGQNKGQRKKQQSKGLLSFFFGLGRHEKGKKEKKTH